MKFRILPVLLGTALVLTTHAAFAGDAKLGEKLYSAKGCIGCHGPGGNSPAPKTFPATAGLKEAYIIEQLKAFKAGKRNNPMMSSMAAQLNEQEMSNLAAYLASQKKLK